MESNASNVFPDANIFNVLASQTTHFKVKVKYWKLLKYRRIGSPSRGVACRILILGGVIYFLPAAILVTAPY